MDQMWLFYGSNLLLVIVLMALVWPFSVIKKDSSIVDVFWGLGFVLVVWNSFAHADGFFSRKLIVAVLTTIWGLRLSLHIYSRNLGKGEDPRYQAFRERYGERYWIVSLFTVFLLQAVLLWVISLAAQSAISTPSPARITWVDVLGVMVWLIGFTFEALADRQLARFKANAANRGKVMNQGLWAYSRHPNYFGESLIWWGIFLIALSNLGNAWTIISPVLITFLLLKVSGVALMEKTIVETKPLYKEYVETTNAFIPWFPKRKGPAST